MSLFRFDFVSEEDLAPKTHLLIPGEAKFKVVGAFSTKKDGTPLTTMSGDPKLRLSFSVTDANGTTSLVYDDITSKMAWKIKALLDSVGLGALYDKSGAFSPEDVVGAMGRCVIETRTPEGATESYNNIKKYIKAENQAVISRSASEPIEEPNDDPLPF